MNSLQHIAISASAGSGKTYTLTNRFIYLLHLFEAPERIIALTFTRTAAGEFFHKIIEKLAAAASDPAKAAQLSKELDIQADASRYQALLARLLSRMHQLNLQTLDSFFFRLVSSFALELGLSGNIQLLDETATPQLHSEVRDRIIHSNSQLNNELNEFWHAFKQATYGQEARSIETTVANFIDNLYALFLDVPNQTHWGQPNTIWPSGCPWTAHDQPDWHALAQQVLDTLPDDLTKQQTNDFHSTARHIEHYPVDEKLNTLLKNALAVSQDILSGNATLKVRKELQLPAPLCTALADALKAILWHHLHRALQNTQGVFRILQAYHQQYDQLVRRPGRLSFADLITLLNPNTGNLQLSGAQPETRELMDFRLDGQFDHWLFDEFQDTSRPQWQIVANLVDEVLQDNSGERSLFYVGDTKQCLYLWRNSDDRLFHDILHYYPHIQQQNLATSWRSAPAILDAVNAVFSDNAWIAECFSPEVAQRWQRAWQAHQPSPATQSLSGYACWLEAHKKDGPTRNERILNLLTELNPIERGLSVGILVRKNSIVTEIADYLRENSTIPVHTGSAIRPASDNSAGSALIAMLQLAAHPADQHARGYLQLVDNSTTGSSLENHCTELRVRLLDGAITQAIEWACHRIREHITQQDTRHHTRLDQLIDLARKFDQEERRDVDRLIDYLRNSSSGEQNAGDAVVIETIHKSKGLEYDIVLLINEDKGQRSDQRISPLLDPQGDTEWILEPIKKDLMHADTELQRLTQQSAGQQGFGALCTLYVGMTRAKRGLYMISDFDRVGKQSTVNFVRELLGTSGDTDGVIWQTGEPNWYQAISAPTPTDSSSATSSEQTTTFKPAHPRLKLKRPSASKRTTKRIHFKLGQEQAEFGTAIHRAFEQITWIDEDTNSLLSSFPQEQQTALQHCFSTEAIQTLLSQPSTPSELWREQAFSYIENDQFSNGVFDRVQLTLDEQGNYIAAQIIDFKTDRIHETSTIDQASEQHRPQMQEYRKALSHITGLSQQHIEIYLIFTDTAELIKLPADD